VIVAAVVCPPAPLLIPGLADRLASASGELRAACDRAVRTLQGAERVVIIGAAAGAAVGVLLPGDLVTAGGLTRSDRPVVPPVRLASGDDDPAASHVGGGAAVTDTAGDEIASAGPGRREPPRVTVSTAVGASLLAAAGITASASALQIATGAGTALMDGGRTGLLVMADGAACHGEHAPGAPDPRSESFDEDLVTALRSGDPQALAATCDRLAPLAPALRADSLPALATFAALITDSGPARAEMLHYSAPFGVGYPVATWQWD